MRIYHQRPVILPLLAITNVTRLGPYKLGRRIGAGGMAAVFAALQETSLGVSRLVALKIIHPGIAPDATQRDLFHREATLATRLEHPSIVRTYDVAEIDGRLLMAMELVIGITLNRFTTDTPLPILVRIVTDVARALDYAHDLTGPAGAPLGIVHQDATPQNIIVGYDGRVRLLDFGVARLAEIDASRTDTVKGKPAYLAPEQIEGERIDRRADIFALGIILHELITGERLFKRQSVAATYRAVLMDPISDVREKRPDVPEALAQIVERALRRDPAARFGSAREMADALAALVPKDVAACTDTELGAFVTTLEPPTFSATMLEQEVLTSSLDVPDGAKSAFDEETLDAPAEPPASITKIESDPKSPVKEAKSRTGIFVLAAAALLLALASLVGVSLHSNPQAVAPAPSASAASLASASSNPISTPAPIASASSSPSAVAPTNSSSPKNMHIAHIAASASAAPDTAPSSVAIVDAAVAAPRAGALSVWSNVWGHVEIDGHSAGDSPIANLPLPVGQHTIRIVTASGEQSRTVNIESQTTARERFVF